MRSPRVAFLLLALLTVPALAASHWTIDGPDGGSVKRLVFDPADASIVYAASTNGLFRSVDGGRHWLAASELLGTAIADVAIARSDSRVVYAVSGYGLYRSSDRGVTWRTLQTGSYFRLAVSAQNPDVVYTASFGGPIRSTDGGMTFGSAGSGHPNGVPSTLAVDPQNAATVYASYPSNAGVYKSSDSGAHWAQATSGLALSLVSALAVDPTNGSTLYACGGIPTMFKSVDGAASWTPLETGLGGMSCAALEVSPSTPSTILAATTEGTLLSTNGGTSWSHVAGIPSASSYAVAFDPHDAATFLAATSIHLYATTGVVSDAGLTAFNTSSIAVDPGDDAVVYAAGPAGLARSADHGRTWSLRSTLAIRTVAVDANGSTLYAIAGTIQRSVDGGITWSPFNSGLPENPTPFFLTADPHLSGTLYAIVNGAAYKKAGDSAWTKQSDGLGDSMDFVTVDPQDSSTLYAGGPLGVYKSTNGALSWAPANNGLTGLNAFGVSVDPFDSRHLFAWSRTTVFESTDAAGHWTALTSGPRGTRYFALYSPGVLYASLSNDVQRSTDGGKSWYSLSEGLPRTHSFLVVGAGGTPYIGDSSAGVFVYHFIRQRAVKATLTPPSTAPPVISPASLMSPAKMSDPL